MPSTRPLVLTAGEPAGVGPELCLALARAQPSTRLVVVADKTLLAARAARLGLDVPLADSVPANAAPAGALEVLHVPLAAPAAPGVLDAANAPYVLATLARAAQGCLDGEFAALVTGPVHKGIIADAGIAFTGHTEFLAEFSGTPRVVMLLAGGGLRVALATTHLPLKDVPAAITRQSLEEVVRILHRDLTQRFGIAAPKILVAGINPHAGEGGHLGREEIETIAPVLEKLRAEGMDLVGPLPADTLFTPRRLEGSSAQLAMYHDQGLAVLKYASFGQGVNVTLGLPFVRTSVDHGTALDLAGTGRADAGSLMAAIAMAAHLARNAA